MHRFRTAALFLSVFTAACAGSAASRRDDAQWLAIQRARLRALRLSEEHRAHPEAQPGIVAGAEGDREHVDAAAQRRAAKHGAAAGVAPQDPPRHIDEMEPPRRDVRSPRPAYDARVGVGVGRVDVRVGGTRLDGHETMASVAGSLEPAAGVAFGPGVSIEYQRSGTGLFHGELVNDGQNVAPADSRIDVVDVSPHLLWRFDAGEDVQLPLRAGVFVDSLRLQNGASALRRTWFGYGARLGFEPSWTFERDGATEWDLCGLLGADAGGSHLRENFVGGRDQDTAWRWMGEAGVGIRLRSGRFLGEVGYRFRNVDLGSTSTELLGDDRNASVRSNMFTLQGGMRF